MYKHTLYTSWMKIFPQHAKSSKSRKNLSPTWGRRKVNQNKVTASSIALLIPARQSNCFVHAPLVDPQKSNNIMTILSKRFPSVHFCAFNDKYFPKFPFSLWKYYNDARNSYVSFPYYLVSCQWIIFADFHPILISWKRLGNFISLHLAYRKK